MQAFGFDYDYTIANYNEEIQPLIYSLTCKHLVDVIGYPKEISHFAYDPNVRYFSRKNLAPCRSLSDLSPLSRQFAIRGLHYDQKNGNLIKLDYLFNLTPGYVYFGRRPLTKQVRYQSFPAQIRFQSYTISLLFKKLIHGFVARKISRLRAQQRL